MTDKTKGIAISNSFDLFNFSRTQTGPIQVAEVFGKEDWIKWGISNDCPQELLRLYQNSDGLHSALIKRKVDMIAGLGWNPISSLLPFISNKYTNEDLNEIAYKCAFDLVLFGGFFVNVIWDANGKSIAKIKHIPLEKVRPQKPQNELGEISNWYISRDWKSYKKEENKPYLIANFCAEDEQLRVEQPSQLLFQKVYSPGMDYLCVPSYYPIINWLKLSFEISTYHLKSAQNAYMPGLIVSIPSKPGPEEREATAQEIKARSGTDEANKTVVVYGESPEQMPTFTVLQPSTSDQKFEKLMETINQEIYIGHNANSIIGGIAIAGKLGASTEIKDAYAHFQTTVIAPLQKKLENTFSLLASLNGYADKMVLTEYQPYKVEQTQPAPSQPTDSTLTPPTQS